MGGLGPGIGGFELVVIGLVALLVVGPKDLPVLMRRVGQMVAKARAMANEFRSSFDEMARQSELDDLRKEVEALRTGQGAVYPLGAEADAASGPAVLIVAPLSGHYATLLRGTVEAFLQDHDVYVTDWVNARQVPMLEGRFDFFDYIDHVRLMLAEIGGRAHVVGVCQPGPPVLAAGAVMAEDEDENRPLSMTFMGSPIDARLSPTVTNQLAEEKPFTWFKSNMIHTVPLPYAGFGRRVYPGFVQLYSFMSMNEDRHRDAHWNYFTSLIAGDGDEVEKHEEFYDEYLSVLDLTEEFYLQTIDIVFQQHLLARGLLEHRGRKVDLSRITDIGLMTVEGEKDDISGVGQTQAAHGLCPNIPEDRRVLYVQPGVGHYGVFNGRRFRDEIYPRVRDFIAQNEAAGGVPQRSAAAA